ncbi:MAG: MFS transporter, partial [Actinomycetia bacterium]|nr:MFS transporter [Actinomycetes bacterium]
PTVATVWLAAVAVGASSATTQPAVQVLLLRWTPPERQRDVFAWQLIALNLALAVGGLVGGFVVDLSSAAGVLPIFYLAAIGSTASATVVWLVGRSARAAVSVAPTASSVGLAAAPARASAADAISYRTLLRRPPIRWLLAVAVLLQLACYSQFTSGLSAYSLDTLALSPKVIGAAIAANTIAVAALTAPVVRLTRRHSPTTLLTVCVVVWIGCWLVLGLPMLVGGFGAAAVLIGYGSFGIGETVMAPVLSPLAASLAPEGAAGRTLASVTGASTAANAVGPVLSGALLALGLPAGFIVLQLACCALTIAAIRRLRVVSRAGAVSAAGPVGSAGSAGGRGSREPMQPAVAVG